MTELLAVEPQPEEHLQRRVAGGEHHRDAVHAQAQLAGIGETQRAWCRRCRAFSVEDDGDGGRCQRCGMQASGYEWVEAE